MTGLERRSYCKQSSAGRHIRELGAAELSFRAQGLRQFARVEKAVVVPDPPASNEPVLGVSREQVAWHSSDFLFA